MNTSIKINKNVIFDSLNKSKETINKLSMNKELIRNLENTIKLVYKTLKSGNKLLFAGNGGSAADAQHMSAEYVSRFMFDRPGLSSVALTTDTSALTAIGNDYGFENLFSRQIQAIGMSGDLFFAYSTSGTSKNIIHAVKEAKRKNIVSIAMTGNSIKAKQLINLCDVSIQIPSNETPYIQEGHLIVGHLICLLVERMIFKK